MVLKVVVVDLYVFIFVPHHHAPPFMYKNHTCHPFHLFVYANVFLELLLLDVVIYYSHVLCNVVVISSITHIMNFFSFCGLKGTWCVTIPRIVTPKGLVLLLINF